MTEITKISFCRIYIFDMVYSCIKYSRKFNVLFILGFFLFNEKPTAQIFIQQLPLDEKEAYIMMKEGVLDSSTWEIVRLYYEQPLNVPLGEIKELVNVFPEIGPNVPVSQEQLTSYEPWARKDIERFFSDFPELNNLKPILSFETSKTTKIGEAGMAIHKDTETDPHLYTQFSSVPNSMVSVQGRIEGLNSSARWQRRSINFSPRAVGTLTAGNFNLDLDKGLFYGYFPQNPSDTDVAQNWQYAGSNTWNGAIYNAYFGQVHGCLFIHRRKSETVYGVKCVTGVTDHINVIAAGSRLLASAAGEARADSIYYCDAGLTFAKSKWNAGIFSGVASPKKSAIPILLYVKNSLAGAEFAASYAGIPDGLPAPRSALKSRFSEKTHQSDSVTGDMHRISLSCRLPVCYRARSSYGASYYYSSGAAAAEGYADVSGRAWIDYALRYTYTSSPGTGAENHTVTAAFSHHLSQRLHCSLHGRCLAASGRYQSVFVRSKLQIVSSSFLEVAPFATVFSASDNNLEVSCGISHVLRIFGKTWSEIKIEAPLTIQNKDQWVLDAKAHFYL